MEVRRFYNGSAMWGAKIVAQESACFSNQTCSCLFMREAGSGCHTCVPVKSSLIYS